MRIDTLVAVMAHQAASATVARHWPHYEKAGCPILGVGRMDKPVDWPAGPEVRSLWRTVSIGNDGYADGKNHLERYLALLEMFLNHPEFKEFDSLMVTEYDSVFLGPVPGPSYGHFVATLGWFGGNDGFAPVPYFHAPWWTSRAIAKVILLAGQRMLNCGITEKGFLDRWLGLLVYLFAIPWKEAEAFSVNTLDTPEHMAAARKAIAAGAWFVHGVKTEPQLKNLLV